MKKDYTWPGKKGQYWIHFEKTQEGKVRAHATDPIRAPSVVGPIAHKTADTDEEAERLLIAELERIDAQ